MVHFCFSTQVLLVQTVPTQNIQGRLYSATRGVHPRVDSYYRLCMLFFCDTNTTPPAEFCYRLCRLFSASRLEYSSPRLLLECVKASHFATEVFLVLISCTLLRLQRAIKTAAGHLKKIQQGNCNYCFESHKRGVYVLFFPSQ